MLKSTELERLLRRSRAASEPQLKSELLRLSSEVKQRRAAGSTASRDFFIRTYKALGQIKGRSHAALRMDSLFECGLYFHYAGDWNHALEVAALLQDLAEATRDQPWLRKAHTFSGIAKSDAGALAEAVVHYSVALELARTLGDPFGEAAVLVNTGIALMYGGHYQDAMPLFQRVIYQTRHTPEIRHLLPYALANLAQAHLYLEEYEEGLIAARECSTISPEPADAEQAMSRTIREYTYVQLALGINDLETARDHCRECMRYAGDSLRGRILAGIAFGLCEVYGGSVDAGLEALNKLQALGTTEDWSRTDLLVALVKAYDAAERPDKALEYLRALLEHVRADRAKTATGILKLGGHSTQQARPSKADLQQLEVRELKLLARTAERETISAQFEMFERLAVTADLKEDASGEHGYRVGRLSALMAEGLHWNKEACRAIDLAARLHDIGKIAMPDRILFTSAQLKEAERHMMSTHTLVGAELLAKSNVAQLRMAEEIAKYHHEWWNGEGYPAKRKGNRIPMHARIVALADVFDALTHGRPFAEAWPIDRAMQEIQERRGTQFDPELTDLFLELVARLRREHKNLDEYLGRAGRSSPFLQARQRIRAMLESSAAVPQNDLDSVH